MARVDIEQLVKESEQKKKPEAISEKIVDGKKYFKGPHLNDWFDDYGECLSANEAEKRAVENKANGLDEHGRTPELVALAAAKASLRKKKELLLDEIAKIDSAIHNLKPEQFKVTEEPKEKKKK